MVVAVEQPLPASSLPSFTPVEPPSTATAGSMAMPLTTSADTAGQAVSTSALYVILGRMKEYGANVVKEKKPWSELLDRNSFSKPANFAEATSRLRQNITLYKVNYLIIMAVIFVIWMVTHPGSLLVLSALMVGWVYVFVIRTAPLSIGGRTLSEREKLLGMAAISLITIFMSSVGAVIFSALALSSVVIALHGAMRTPDDLFIDSNENNQQGFLSIFTAPTVATGPGQV